ncbi:MAG: hypothetical protein GXP27_13295 [Planctomycetes bacterium]|nr:hypothetical protein [Planctomycetota bacterium]
MNGRERVVGLLRGEPIDSLPLMPITMLFAARHVGVPYGRYAADYRVLVDTQLQTADDFDFDYVTCISDPAREAADCGAVVHYPDDQPPAIDESQALLADKSKLLSLKVPDPLGGGRMFDRVQRVPGTRRGREGDRGMDRRAHGRSRRPARHQHRDARLLRRPAVCPRSVRVCVGNGAAVCEGSDRRRSRHHRHRRCRRVTGWPGLLQ